MIYEGFDPYDFEHCGVCGQKDKYYYVVLYGSGIKTSYCKESFLCCDKESFLRLFPIFELASVRCN
jgi:hypothetical protein